MWPSPLYGIADRTVGTSTNQISIFFSKQVSIPPTGSTVSFVQLSLQQQASGNGMQATISGSAKKLDFNGNEGNVPDIRFVDESGRYFRRNQCQNTNSFPLFTNSLLLPKQIKPVVSNAIRTAMKPQENVPDS